MPNNSSKDLSLTELDQAIIRATQSGLPLCERPYHAIAETIGIDAKLLMERINHMLETGIIRRIGVVPNHYALGYRANGMTVWDVPEEYIDDAGQKIGDLDFVSHCYQRVRHPPDWNYNLFAMVHGKEKGSTERKVREISRLLREYNRGNEVLYSKRILKKTGVQI